MKKNIILLFCLLLSNTLFGLDELLEFKLKLGERYKPAKDWKPLKWDQSFSLDYEEPGSYIKYAPCFEIIDDNFVIPDNRTHKLVVFDKTGRFKSVVGKPGRGPGDIEHPSWLEVANNELYVKNNNGIDVFDDDFKFKRRIRTFHSIYRFSVVGDTIYCLIRGAYHQKFPLLLKLNATGGVESAVYCDEMKDPLYRKSNRGDILPFGQYVAIVTNHWNRLYLYDKKRQSILKKRIKYPLLDKLETWNDRNKKPKNPRVLWFAGMVTAAKQFQGKLYVLLNNPRLEILCIDSEGSVLDHFYNDSDFRKMRWFDFDVRQSRGSIVFYVLGFSVIDEKNRDDFNIFKLTVRK